MSVKNITHNRRARFDYEVMAQWEAGLVLSGNEIKLIRCRAVSIQGSFAIFRQQELFLMNIKMGQLTGVNYRANDQRQSCKLLLHKKQLCYLHQQITQHRLVIVPLQLYLKDQRAKVIIALARPRKQYDKRRAINARQLARRSAWKQKNWKSFKK